MPTYVALLRAVNVGKRKAPMAKVRAHLERAGFDDVRTVLNSGNVVLHSDERRAAAIERTVEQELAELLGFDVETFVRTPAQLRKIADHEAFGRVVPTDRDSVYIGFLKARPGAAVKARVEAMSNDADLLHLHGRELYWLVHGRMMDSRLPPGGFERAFGGPQAVTVRNLKTVVRLAAMG